MNAPNDRTERHLPSATTRAIARENLTEHLIQASARALNGTAELTRQSCEAIVSELLDFAFRIEHQPRGDRLRITLNPPPVGSPLPPADGREHVAPAVVGGARAEQAQIAGEVTADGSTILPPTETVEVWPNSQKPGGQCDVWSAGVRCRYSGDVHEGDHSFGGGMGDPVDLKHCGDRDEHPAHAWRPNAGKGEPHACSGKPLTERAADAVPNGEGGWAISDADADEILANMSEGDGSPDDVAATGTDEAYADTRADFA